MKRRTKKRIYFWSVIAAILIASALIFNYFFIKSVKQVIPDQSGSPLASVGTGVVVESEISRQKNEIMSRLNQLRRYGQWPLINIKLSQERGNPFIKP